MTPSFPEPHLDLLGNSIADYVVGCFFGCCAVGDCVVGDTVGNCVVGDCICVVSDSVCIAANSVSYCRKVYMSVCGTRDSVGYCVGDCVVGDTCVVGDCVVGNPVSD